jgi:PAS domain S-box-containing protein
LPIEPLWLFLALVSTTLSAILFTQYAGDRNQRKLMFALSFLSSSISWFQMAFASETAADNLMFRNIYIWPSTPLMLAVFIAIEEKLFPSKNFVWHFRLFLIGFALCYAFSILPWDLSTLYSMVSIFISVSIFASSIYLFIRDKNSLDLLYFFAVVAFMVGGMSQAEDNANLSIFAFTYGYLLLGFLFLGDVKGSKGAYFSMKKRLEDVERDLAATEERYRRIVENASNVILLTDIDGKVTYVSPSVKTLLNMDTSEIVGKSVFDLCPDNSQKVADYYSKIGGASSPFEFEHRCPGNLQSPRWMLHTISTFSTDDCIEVMHNMKDISDIREAKEVLNQKLRDLEMSERASLNIMEDLNETVDTLKSMEKKLASKNKELEDYTYTVSHDLKAPLVTIQGFSDLLRQNYGEKLDDKGRHYIDRINQGSERLNRLISDLLELSRAGRKLKPFEWHDFNAILKGSLESLEGKIVQGNVKVSHPHDFPKIFGDDMRLSQVVNNLVGNAVNYMGDQKSPEISIGWRDSDGYYEFWIQDNGIGIKPEDQGRIFNIFERASEQGAEGSGIGLSIVKKIVETHGGEIRVESEFGRGSKFIFTIPKTGVQE